MNVQKTNDNSSTVVQKSHASLRQPPLQKKETSTTQLNNVNHYDPSQRGSSKRRPAPVKQGQTTQSRKLSGIEEQVNNQQLNKNRNDIAIIKNSDLQQIKSSLGKQDAGGESIFGLMNQKSQEPESEFAGLNVYKQRSQPPILSPPRKNTEENVTAHVLQQQESNNEVKNRSPMIATNNQVEFIGLKNQSNLHQMPIVGSNLPGMTANQFMDKDARQKAYQDELQRQIRERDEIRKKEQDEKVRKFGSIIKQQDSNEVVTGFFPWQQRQQQEQQNYGNENAQFMSSDKNLQQRLNEINYENRQASQFPQTFYNEQTKSNMYQTKMDFPNIMTRGKVMEGRIDIELQQRGTIFQGRDEKSILMKKKEESQNAIKEALQRQIEEKNRQKEEAKIKERDMQMREEQKLRQDGFYDQVPTFARKTTYNNHNQVSIIGSNAGGASLQTQEVNRYSNQEHANMKSPTQNSATNRQYMQLDNEENIMNLGGSNQRNNENNQVLVLQQEVAQIDVKNQQINDLSEMVKVLLEEQKNLKEKLENQEQKMKEISNKESVEEPLIVRKQTAITKKASERVRSQNPKQKTVQSADNKTLQARKLKEQHAIEQAKLEAIENKIQKARLRIEEAKVQKSVKAQQTILKNGNNGDNINDLLYGNEDDQQENIVTQQQHVPIIGGRHKSTAGIMASHDRAVKQLSTAPHNQKSLYQNAGTSLNNRNGMPPTAAVGNNKRNLLEKNQTGKPQKAPRGPGNKIQQSQIPLSSIDYDDNQEEEDFQGYIEQNNGISNKSSPQQRYNQNNSKLVNQTNDHQFNLDSDGVSQLQYPTQEGQFYSPNLINNSTKKISASPIRQQDNYDPSSLYNRNQSVSSNNYNHNMANNDPTRYQQHSQQANLRQKGGYSDFNYDNQMEFQGSKEFLNGAPSNLKNNDYYISKNPSTAAGSYLHGLGGGYGGGHHGLTSGGGIGQMATESFDLDIMMPPDIASIDSDISNFSIFQYSFLDKLNAMTPTPMQNMGWNFDNNFGYGGSYAHNDSQSTHKISNNYQFDDSQSIYDSKYSPSRANGGASAYSRDMHGTRQNQNINRFYDQ